MERGLRSSFDWDLDFMRDLISDTTRTLSVDLDEEEEKNKKTI